VGRHDRTGVRRRIISPNPQACIVVGINIIITKYFNIVYGTIILFIDERYCTGAGCTVLSNHVYYSMTFKRL